MGEQLLDNDVASLILHGMRKGSYPRFARKLFKAGDVSGLAGAINITYGAVVYDHVNRETNGHAIIKKEGWERSGFRYTNSFSLATDAKGYGGADPGSVGAVLDATLGELSTNPAFLHTPYDVTMDAGFRATHDDGLDVYEWKLSLMRDVHAQLLNEQLLKNVEYAAADSTGNTTDAKASTATTNVDTRGLGHESIDRLIASQAEEADLGGANTGWFDVYESSVDRDGGSTFDSVVVRPDGSKTTFGTDIAFQMKGIDVLIDDTEANGGREDSSIFLTNRDTRRAFYNELSPHARYDLTQIQAKLDMNGLSSSATHDGRDVTFTQRAYQKRPIVVDQRVPREGTRASPSGKGHWFLIDQRYMYIRVGFPTLYVDVDNPVIRGQFDTKALYLTCQQPVAPRFNVHGKMRAIA